MGFNLTSTSQKYYLYLLFPMLTFSVHKCCTKNYDCFHKNENFNSATYLYIDNCDEYKNMCNIKL